MFLFICDLLDIKQHHTEM